MIKWLERYKIIFETVAASLLAIMSIIVGISQYAQMKLQNRIAEMQIAPHFVARITLAFNRVSELYDSDSLIIENKGGLAYNVAAEYAVELTSNRIDSSFQSFRDTLFVNYYGHTSISPNGVGEVLKASDQNIRFKYFELEKRIRSENQKTKQIILLNLTRYVKVSYVTMLGEKRSEYYRVNEIGGGEKLEDDFGSKYFDSVYNRLSRRLTVSLDTLSPRYFMQAGKLQ